MRKLWLKSVALSLGLLVTGARGQEQIARSSPGPIASPGRPIAIATSNAAPTTSKPVATIDKPIAIATTATRDPNVQQTSFTPARPPLRPVFRGSAPDLTPHQPMPMGPEMGASAMPAAGLHNWSTKSNVVATTTSRSAQDTVSAAPPPPRTGAETLLVPPTPATSPMPGVPGTATMNGPGPIMPPTMNQPGPAGIAPAPGTGPTPEGPFPVPGVIAGPGVVTSPGVIVGDTGTCCPAPVCGPVCCGDSWNFGGCGKGGRRGGWGCDGCCDGPRLLIDTEFLLWWMAGDNTPPLVVQGPGGLNQNNYANVLNTQGQVVSGGLRKADNVRPGGRLSMVYWFTDRQCWGIDASGFFLGNADDSFYDSGFNSGLVTSVARGPVLNALLNDAISFEEVSGPALNGQVTVSRQSNLWGADVNLRRNLWCCDNFRGDFLVGARILGLDENLSITENLIVANAAANRFGAPNGTPIMVNDSFVTQNRFYGPQFGVDGEYRFGNFSLGFRGKLAMGVTQQMLQIRGLTEVGGVTLTNSATGGTGGLLAQTGTNIGNYRKDMFGVIPEVGLTLGYNIFDWWRITAGYNFLYWNSVVRPGEQIDRRVNPAFFPGAVGGPNGNLPAGVNPGDGPKVPAKLFSSSDLYIHGVTFGMEFRY